MDSNTDDKEAAAKEHYQAIVKHLLESGQLNGAGEPWFDLDAAVSFYMLIHGAMMPSEWKALTITFKIMYLDGAIHENGGFRFAVRQVLREFVADIHDVFGHAITCVN